MPFTNNTYTLKQIIKNTTHIMFTVDYFLYQNDYLSLISEKPPLITASNTLYYMSTIT